MAPRGIIFDLFGTLFIYGNMEKAFFSWHESLAMGAKELGFSINTTQMAKECENFFSFPITGLYSITPYEERLLYLFKKIGMNPSLNWICHFSNHSMDSWQDEISLHPEAIPFLKQLRKAKVKTAILSNFDHYPHVYRFLKQTKLYDLMDEIVVSSEVHLKKPDAKVFEYTLKRLNLSASSTLMVGDDYKKDIEGAKTLGLLTYYHENGASFAPLCSFFKDVYL